MQHVLTSQIHPDLPQEIWEVILKRTDPGTCLTFCRSDLISDCDLEDTLREMLDAGNLTGIRTLYGRISGAFDGLDSALREKLETGSPVDVQKFFLGRSSAAYNEVDSDMMIGHLHVFLHNNQHLAARRGSERAMDVAAENGHLHVVRWLHDNWTKGCSVLAMNSAAENGHLPVVRWLHDNRHEGCSKDAMNLATINGHLDVVRWLHGNRDEGCPREAMYDAAWNDHWPVARWLHENCHENCHEECWKLAMKEIKSYLTSGYNSCRSWKLRPLDLTPRMVFGLPDFLSSPRDDTII